MDFISFWKQWKLLKTKKRLINSYQFFFSGLTEIRKTHISFSLVKTLSGKKNCSTVGIDLHVLTSLDPLLRKTKVKTLFIGDLPEDEAVRYLNDVTSETRQLTEDELSFVYRKLGGRICDLENVGSRIKSGHSVSGYRRDYIDLPLADIIQEMVNQGERTIVV